MSYRFWRRVKILPGVTLNLSKSGGSLSFGPKGAKVTFGPRGTRTSVGIPGTGLFYTQQSTRSRRGRGQPQRDPLTLGFLQRLITPKEEQSLLDGRKDLVSGKEEEALDSLVRASPTANGGDLAG